MLFLSYFIIFSWIIALIFIMSIGVPLLIGIIDKLTGEIKIWNELKKKNTAVAMVVSSTILGICLLIGLIF